MAEEILELCNISKTFPGVKALDNIHFTLKPGEIHSICGENGAGKSTLIKIISGAYQPDAGGDLLYEGKKVSLDPLGAIELGIQTIYQELTNFGTLSVAENIFVGMEITERGLIQRAEMVERTKEVLDYLHADIDPDALMEDLSAGEQKIVEFAKALVFDRKVIILDEPTASFSVAEIDNLLDVVQKIKKRGIGIIYISHHLDEVFRIADRITVLRDGEHIKTTDTADTNEAQLIRDMVGRDASAFYTREFFKPGEVVLDVEDLTGNGVFGASFKLRRGEILGFAGMVGSGRSELMTLLFGGAEKHSGKVSVLGNEVNFRTPRDAIRNHMCYITEDRQYTGLFLIHNIARNIVIANMVNTKGVTVDPGADLRTGEEMRKQLDIRTPSVEVLAENLSGGNQQKVVLAKWFTTDGEIYIFDEPTRGIDVGAKQEIYQVMTDLLEQNKAIIMVSSDMPEVVSMSDRVMVMKNGRVAGELQRDDISEESILELSIGGAKI